MSLKLSAQIARTHLAAKPRQTIIASLGVTFGIAMFILMISFMTGVNNLLTDTMLTSTPHIRIFHDIEANRPSILDAANAGDKHWNVVHHQKPKDEQLNLRNGLLQAKRIEAEPRVLGVSPQLTTQVFYNYGPTQLTGILAGVDIEKEDKLYNLKSKIRSGSMDALKTTTDGVMLGAGLAKKLNVKTGDKLTITTPFGQTMLLRIVGIYRMGIGQIDDVRSYATISTVQKILQRDTRYISDLHIKLLDLEQAKPQAQQYQALYGYKAEDWETANASILVSFVIRNILTYVVVTTLLVVAGFGIYNIMNMTIVDKMKDIAILKATGFEGRDVVSIFLLQAAFIGLLGGLVGLLLGYILSYSLSKVPFDSGGFLAVETFPVNMNPLYYVFGLLFGIGTTILAGYFPSRKAAKIDPVSILRG